jgi:hypothetical protein
VFHDEEVLFYKMAIRDVKSMKNQLGLPPRPKLYDQCIIGSIGFEFLAYFKGGLAGVC